MKSSDGEFSSKTTVFVHKYFFWFAAALFIILSFFIIRNFIIALISSFVLAYLALPLHRKISKKIDKRLSAVICIFIIILSLLTPLFLILLNVITQINTSFDLSSGLDLNLPLVTEFFPTLKYDLLNILLNVLTSTLPQIPYLILSIAITVIGTYYLLIDWDSFTKKVEFITPFKDKKRIRSEVSTLTNNIIYGYVFIALVELIVGVLGFYISGVKLFLLLPAIMALLAFIPGLGPGIIWMPTAVYYLALGEYFTATGVIITGLIISIFVETFLLPKIVQKNSKIHPLIFLLGVLGGVPIFGIFGFIIGPLILVYTLKLIEESLVT